MLSLLRYLVLLLALDLAAAAATALSLRVATLNCYLLFDPSINHRGKVDDQERMTDAEYQTKLRNLASLVRGYQVVGLQEMGGGSEVSALAEKVGMKWVWQRGTDTATGQEVGLIYDLPSWLVTSRGRVADLDRLLSKHLLVEARNGESRVFFLVIHLVRPIGNQINKHKDQLEAVGAWMKKTAAADPNAVIVVLGDSNSALTRTGVSLFGVGSDAGELVGFKSTHLTNRPFDRMVAYGPASWNRVEVKRPPYGDRPVAPLKRVWTDHYLFGADLILRANLSD